MTSSNFASVHGMYIETNYSSAHDIAKVCFHVMKIDLFRQIVATEYKECNSRVFPGEVYKWTNTNFLLKDPTCTGIKTGIT